MKRALLLSVGLLWAWGLALAQGLQPVPQLTGRVIDQTGTLDAVQTKALEDKLAAFEASKGTQIVVLMVATTQPEDIASYANRIGNTWKIGRKEVGDGILLVVAKDDRKVRIEVAKTLEGAVPDLAAKQVIDEAITPRFRQGDFAGGLQAAADQLIARVNGEPLPQPTRSGGSAAAGEFDWSDLALVAFFAVPVVGAVLRGIFGSKLGALATGGMFGGIAWLVTASLLAAGFVGVIAMMFALASGAGRRGGGPWVSSGGGGSWSGGGGSWDFGGGFSSGGGGDFGGGGASGDW